MSDKKLSSDQHEKLIEILRTRFAKNKKRHEGINWDDVQAKLEQNPTKMWSLDEMELSGGEPDVIGFDSSNGEFIFCDCSAESPSGRRSFCYDRKALDARKAHKPANSIMDMAEFMGVDVIDETQYRELQKLGPFDAKTSSWLKTPSNIRDLGGAIFGDYRFGTIFIYHNGAESYYAARGFRGILRV